MANKPINIKGPLRGSGGEGAAGARGHAQDQDGRVPGQDAREEPAGVDVGRGGDRLCGEGAAEAVHGGDEAAEAATHGSPGECDIVIIFCY